jgi:hypothetical protein
MEQATFISEEMLKDFHRTLSALQQQPQHGWGLGALIAMPLNKQARAVRI